MPALADGEHDAAEELARLDALNIRPRATQPTLPTPWNHGGSMSIALAHSALFGVASRAQLPRHPRVALFTRHLREGWPPMRSHIAKCLVLIGAILLIPASLAYAQEAVLTGTVSDTTGGVLPGVVVHAVHVATGNAFETVTDERGSYRVPVRVGTYRL